MIVMKFGGTSNQDARAISNVVQIINSSRSRKPVVVISAIARATNLLERIAHCASEGMMDGSREALSELFNRHCAIADDLITSEGRRSEMRRILDSARTDLEELMKGVEILRELTPRTLDAFYSFGELLSSQLVAMALTES